MHKPPTSTSPAAVFSSHPRSRMRKCWTFWSAPGYDFQVFKSPVLKNAASSMTAPVSGDSNHGGVSQAHHVSDSPTSLAIQVMSDLHLETPKFLPMYNEFQIEKRAKYLALLGDIGLAADDSLFDFLAQQLRQFEVIFYVLGNHEPYLSRYDYAVERMEAFEENIESRRVLKRQDGNTTSSLDLFVFLNRRRFDLSSKITILGCTLFSHISDEQRSTVSLFVSDFSNIADWSVDRHNAAHRVDLAWLNAEVETIARNEPYRSVVVLTHYSPTAVSEANDPEHVEDSRGVQSAFVTDLQDEPCWVSPVVKVWVFGHTHYNCEFVDGKTGKLVVANQRGYGRENIFNFDGEKTLDIV